VKNVSGLGVLSLVLILCGASSMKADTMDYTLTGPGISQTFSVAQNPSFTGSANSEIIVSVSGLNGFGVNTIDFFSSSNGGGLGAILNFGSGNQQYQLDGPQLFSFANGIVTLASGDFTLDYVYSLKAVDPPGTTATPEPTIALILASGLIGLAMLRKSALVVSI
jgi:hypothetical protein